MGTRKKFIINKKIQLVRDKIKNMITDLHYKTAKTLCSSYNTVILPHFAVSSIVSNSNNLNKTTKKELLTLSHGLFRRRMISKSEITGCTLLIPENEFQTTRTCGNCFSINNGVGTSEIFQCSKCGLEAGRDSNASRNIFLRQLMSIK